MHVRYTRQASPGGRGDGGTGMIITRLLQYKADAVVNGVLESRLDGRVRAPQG